MPNETKPKSVDELKQSLSRAGAKIQKLERQNKITVHLLSHYAPEGLDVREEARFVYEDEDGELHYRAPADSKNVQNDDSEDETSEDDDDSDDDTSSDDDSPTDKTERVEAKRTRSKSSTATPPAKRLGTQSAGNSAGKKFSDMSKDEKISSFDKMIQSERSGESVNLI